MELMSVKNFRELGGIKNKDGKQIRKGCFYRSGKLSGLCERDIQIIQKLNLKLILDLRGEEEANKFPDEVPKDCAYVRISGIPGHDPKKQNLNFMNLIHDNSSEEEIRHLHQILIDSYLAMPFDNEALKYLLHHIKEKDEPILFHCSAGKDRTGFLSAALLLLLDAEESVIMKNYMESNRYFTFTLKDFMERHHLKNEAVGRMALDTLYVKEAYLQSALNEIQGRYGTYMKYFKEEYELTNEDIQYIRQKYLI